MDAQPVTLADKVLIISARLARQGKFVGMDIIEAVLTAVQEIDDDARADQLPIDPGSGYVPAGVRPGKR